MGTNTWIRYYTPQLTLVFLVSLHKPRNLKVSHVRSRAIPFCWFGKALGHVHKTCLRKERGKTRAGAWSRHHHK
jgi:hypothetical protein